MRPRSQEIAVLGRMHRCAVADHGPVVARCLVGRLHQLLWRPPPIAPVPGKRVDRLNRYGARHVLAALPSAAQSARHIHRARLVGIEGNIVFVQGSNCLDGTPLLDIKPDRAAFTPIAPPQPGDFEVG